MSLCSLAILSYFFAAFACLLGRLAKCSILILIIVFNLVWKLNEVARSCTILLVLFHWQTQSNLISLLIEFDAIQLSTCLGKDTSFTQ